MTKVELPREVAEAYARELKLAGYGPLDATRIMIALLVSLEQVESTMKFGFTGTMIDLTKADTAELTVDRTGKVWVNVDGRCALRIGHVDTVHTEATKVDGAEQRTYDYSRPDPTDLSDTDDI